MPTASPARRARRLAPLLIGLALLAALAARLAFLPYLAHPGRSDYAFYYTVARNVAAGRGLVVDYVWHFLVPAPAVTHYSADYWQPLASLIMAGAMRAGGPSLAVALLPGIAAGLLLAAVAHATARTLAPSPLVAYGAAGLTLALPTLFEYSLLTDAAIYYALFASTCLLCLMRLPARPAWAGAAALCAALAHLTRQDGVLLAPVVAAALLVAPHPWRRRAAWGAAALAIYLAALAPWLAANLAALGAPLPGGSARTAFLTTYEDLYASARELSPRAYLAWGWGNILRARLDAAAGNLRELYALLRLPLGLLCAVGAVALLRRPEERRRWRVYLPPALFLAALFGFYALVAPFTAGGAFRRSVTAMAPFLAAVAMLGLEALTRRAARPWLAPALALAVAALLAAQGAQLAAANARAHGRLGTELALLGAAVAEDAARRGAEPIVMTRSPWELNAATGLRAVQIPNEDLAEILAVARRYGVTYVVLPAPRAALAGLAEGAAADPRLTLVGPVAGTPYTLLRVGP